MNEIVSAAALSINPVPAAELPADINERLKRIETVMATITVPPIPMPDVDVELPSLPVAYISYTLKPPVHTVEQIDAPVAPVKSSPHRYPNDLPEPASVPVTPFSFTEKIKGGTMKISYGGRTRDRVKDILR